jgi:hypothetical protein
MTPRLWRSAIAHAHDDCANRGSQARTLSEVEAGLSDQPEPMRVLAREGFSLSWGILWKCRTLPVTSSSP